MDERRNIDDNLRYESGIINVKILGKKNITNQNGIITRKLNNRQVRIVLTWGSSHKDLDGHLVGKYMGSNSGHVYYSNKIFQYFDYDSNIYKILASLDKDDTSGNGVETITLNIPKDMTSKLSYYVHDYFDRNSASTKNLAKSGATVEVYVGGQKTPIKFYVPSSGIGNLWKVFEIDPISMKIIPVNIFKNESSPGNVGDVSNNNSKISSYTLTDNDETEIQSQADDNNETQIQTEVDDDEEVQVILSDIFENSKE